MSKASNAKRRTAATCLATLSLAVCLFAPSALAASKPTAVTGSNTPFPEGKVHLLGYVGPEGSKVTACKFVYGPEAGNYTSEAPCENHPGDEIQALSVGATGGNFRLGFGGEESIELPYNAGAAEVQSALEALPAVGAGGVSVQRVIGTLDYRRYWISFEGPLADTDVQALTPIATGVPLSAEPAEKPYIGVETLVPGGLSEPHEVTADLAGLNPGATYHYRLLATNGQGTSESENAVFRAAAEEPSVLCPNQGAPGVGFLPECRAWEMVSPPAKNGGDVLADSEGGTNIAADGSAASFLSPSPFGDTSGAGTVSEYEAVRDPSGWQTHGILPSQPPTSFIADVESLEPHYEGDFSSDLNKGVVSAFRPLDNSDPNVSEAVNLYLRTDLRSPGAGAYTLLTRCPLCAEEGAEGKPLPEGFTASQAPRVIGASADFKHVVFESRYNLVKPANSPLPKLYESEEGTVRLLGVLPNGTPAFESTASGPHNPPEVFQNRAHTVSSDGSKVFWTDGTNLYLRLHHEDPTIQLNESELPSSEGNGTAHFQDATPDGSKVFFTDGTRLSEVAPKGGGLYVYDTTKPASDPHNLSFIAAPGGPIPGVSANGETVYFGHSLWHDGGIRSIGSFEIASETAHVQARVSSGGQLLFGVGSGSRELPHPLQPQFPGYCPAAGSHPLCGAFYTYDPATEALQCISCPPPGESAQDVTPGLEVSVGNGNVAVTARFSHPLSADGRLAFFNTNAALVPEDTNGTVDVYVFNTETSRIGLLSHGTDPYPSYFMEATPSGSDALFTTRQRLSGWDIDGNVDLYDARVGGGLPEPLSVPEGCHGEACPLPPLPSPAREPTASGRLQGSGNPKQVHCPRGTHPVTKAGKTRCVKPKRHKKRRNRRHGGRK